MALKRKIPKSMEEQLYMLEVFVDQLNLRPDQISPVNIDDLTVCVRFTNLPQYTISYCKSNQTTLEKSNEQTGYSIDFKFGKSCIFAKTPKALVRAMRWSPLRMEVYHKESLLGSAKMSFPDCMCNQVATAENKIDGLSAPCITKHTFDLNDSDGKTTGQVSFVLRLSCFGSSVVKQFSLNDKSFVLENSPLDKFLCPYLSTEDTENKKDSTDENGDVKPLLKRPDSPPHLSINDPGFKYLTAAEKLNDPRYREIIYKAYPDEPTCSCLPEDRSTHPMECRSGCNRPCCMKLRDPDILSTQDKTVEDTLANTYCVSNFLSSLSALEHNPPCGNATRLRGGGDVEQIYIDPAGTKWTDYDTDYTVYDDRNNRELRLEGGGEKGMSSCSCSGGAVPVQFRKSPSKEDVAAIFDACKPRMTSTGPKPSCACPGRGTNSWQKGSAKCMNSPCMGIDCLIRAFKEAQEFVDSIGKVPGLPGLGLMDPSESPYFGRDIDNDYVPQEAPMEPRKKQIGLQQIPEKPPCSAPCNVQQGKSSDDVRPYVPSMYAPPPPIGLSIPPRLGIVREAIPVLPEIGSTSTRQRKKEEKLEKQKELEAAATALADIEIGPCGEPKCKSRRKKPPEPGSATQSATHVSSKTRAVGRSISQKKSRKGKVGFKRQGASKIRSNVDDGRGRNPYGKGQSKPYDNLQSNASKQRSGKGGKPGAMNRPMEAIGPGGDRTTNSKQFVAVNRRVMRYVYFAGDMYPGITYGHRNCIDIRMRVPANMGWLWNTLATYGKLKPRLGWRPGAIARYVYELLQDAKEESMQEEIIPSRVSSERETTRGAQRGGAQRGKMQRGKIQRRANIRRGVAEKSERSKSVPGRRKSPGSRGGGASGFPSGQRHAGVNGEEGIEAPPTLHIHRKDGTYYVTMYPIKQETPEEPTVSEPMKPLQFKIVKNKDEGSAASSSTASDMEIEFSPPAAITRQRKKPDVVHVDTQVRQQEILDAIKAEINKKKDGKSRREKRAKK